MGLEYQAKFEIPKWILCEDVWIEENGGEEKRK